MNEPIYVLETDTLEKITSYNTVKDLRNATGWGASKAYRLLNTPVKNQPGEPHPHYPNKLVVISRKLHGHNLVLADPKQEYIVTDGTLVYHKGLLSECQQMKKQLGFSTLIIKKWIPIS